MDCLIDQTNRKIEKNPKFKKVYGGYFISVSNARSKTDCMREAGKLIHAINKGYEFLAESERPVSMDKSLSDGVKINVHIGKKLEDLYDVKNGLMTIDEWNKKYRGKTDDGEFIFNSPRYDDSGGKNKNHISANYRENDIKELIKKNEVKLEVKPDGTSVYVGVNDGTEYRRVTSLKNKNIEDTKGAAARGTIIDLALRDFINSANMTLKGFKEKFAEHDAEVRKKIDKENEEIKKYNAKETTTVTKRLKPYPLTFSDQAVEELYVLFNEFAEGHFHLVSDIPTLAGEIKKENKDGGIETGTKIAGTIDILNITEHGGIEIIDLKTSSHDRFLSNLFYVADVNQQSYYAELFHQITGTIPTCSKIFAIRVIEEGNVITGVKSTVREHKLDETLAKGLAYKIPYDEDIVNFKLTDASTVTISEFVKMMDDVKNENQKPLGRQYEEILRWKREQLDLVRQKLKVLSAKKTESKEQTENRGQLSIAKQRKILNDAQTKLEAQIQFLRTNKEYGKYTVVHNDLRHIARVMDISSHYELMDLANRLKFYDNQKFEPEIIYKTDTKDSAGNVHKKDSIDEQKRKTRDNNTILQINAMKTSLRERFKDANKNLVLRLMKEDSWIKETLRNLNKNEKAKIDYNKHFSKEGKSFEKLIRDHYEGEIKLKDNEKFEEIAKLIDKYIGLSVSKKDMEKVYPKNEVPSNIQEGRNIIDDLTKEGGLLDYFIERGMVEKGYKNKFIELLKTGEFGRYEDFTTEDLLAANADIDIMSENVLGIISSMTGDTVIPQFIYRIFSNELHRNDQESAALIDKLEKFLKENKGKITDEQMQLFFNRDSKGNKDGFLADPFTEEWYDWSENKKNEKGFGYLVSSFGRFQNPVQKIKDYEDILKWMDKNAIVINFLKLPEVRKVYETHPRFGKYFTNVKEDETYVKQLKERMGPKYKSVVNNILTNLSHYEHDTSVMGSMTDRMKASSNIWDFMSRYGDEKNPEAKKGFIQYQQTNDYNNVLASLSKTTVKARIDVRIKVLDEIKNLNNHITIIRSKFEKQAPSGEDLENLRKYETIAETAIDYLIKDEGLSREHGEFILERIKIGALSDKTEIKNVLFSDFKNVMMIPKDPSFDSANFKKIKENPLLTELWDIYRESGEYINNVYGNISSDRVGLPMVKTPLSDRMMGYMRDMYNSVFNRSKERSTEKNPMMKFILEPFRELTRNFFQKIKTKDKQGIISNSQDAARMDIERLAETYVIQGVPREEAIKKARERINKYYFGDINASIKQMLAASAMHRTRHTAEPIVTAMMNVYNTVLSGNKERSAGKAKLLFWVNKFIKNHSNSEMDDGRWSSKPFHESRTMKNMIKAWGDVELAASERTRKTVSEKLWKRFTEQEDILHKEYREILKNGIKDGQEMEINEEINGIAYKFSVKELKDEHGNRTGAYSYHTNMKVNPQTNEIDFKNLTETDQDLNDLGFVDSSKKQFESALGYYIMQKMDAMGSVITVSSIFDGVMIWAIFKALGLSPISGVKNRAEGILTNNAVDAYGEYWTPGNYMKAKGFMGFSNLLGFRNMSLDREHRGKKKQMIIFKHLMNKLGGLQEKHDTLERMADKEKAYKANNLFFSMSINFPEFKNQGEVFLCTMMDYMVTVPKIGKDGKALKDKNGKTVTEQVPFFDKTKMEFTLFDIDMSETVLKGKKDKFGVINVKPEYRDHFDMSSPQMENLRLKLTTNVSRIQGNFSKTDGMKIKTSITGRMVMMFKTYLAEHINSRYAGMFEDFDKNLNIDLSNQRVKRKGRNAELYHSSSAVTAAYMAIAGGMSGGWLYTIIAMSGLATGVVGTIALSAATIPFLAGVMFTGVYAAKHLFFTKHKIREESHQILKMAYFIESTVSNTWNTFPLFLSSLTGGKNAERLTIRKTILTGKKQRENIMTKEEAQAIHACATELGAKVAMFMVMIAIVQLFKPDDDKLKDSPEKRWYNQLMNLMVQLQSMGDAAMFVYLLADELGRNMVVQTVKDIAECVKKLSDGKWGDAGESGLKALPIPKLVHSPIEYLIGPDYDLTHSWFGGNMGYKYLGDAHSDIADKGEGLADKKIKGSKAELKDANREKFARLARESKDVMAAINKTYVDKYFNRKDLAGSNKKALKANEKYGENVSPMLGLTKDPNVLKAPVSEKEFNDLLIDNAKITIKKKIKEAIWKEYYTEKRTSTFSPPDKPTEAQVETEAARRTGKIIKIMREDFKLSLEHAKEKPDIFTRSADKIGEIKDMIFD